MEENKKTASAVLAIDCRSRQLSVFVASVTQAQSDNHYQLVLRHALEMGELGGLLESSEREDYEGARSNPWVKRQGLETEMPVLLMGGYSAKSSWGHVSVLGSETASSLLRSEEACGHRKVLVVGGLGPAFGPKGLKVLGKPILSVLIRGPVRIGLLAGGGNLNAATARAAEAGAALLASTDSKSVFVVEGQSNYEFIVRLRSRGKGITTFPVEHREEMFSRENIVRRMVRSAAYWDLARGRGEDNRPSEGEVAAEVKQRLEVFLAARSAGEDEEEPWKRLGKGFGALNMCDEAILAVARELGAKSPIDLTNEKLVGELEATFAAENVA